LSRSDWAARLALFGAIAVLIAASVAAREFLAPPLVSWASRLTHASSAWMFAAGWATAGFLPAAFLVFLLDGNRRERHVDAEPRNRPRSARGHAVPGPGAGYWIRRTPLALPLLAAFVFAPFRGGWSWVNWHGTPGGDAFRHAWQLSFQITLAAVIVLLVFRLVAFLPGNGDRLLRLAGPLVAAAPALGLLGLSTYTS
jgi:hypothetical protein